MAEGNSFSSSGNQSSPGRKKLSLARKRRGDGGSQSPRVIGSGSVGFENVGVGVAMGWDKEGDGGVVGDKKKKRVRKAKQSVVVVIDSDDEIDFPPRKKQQIRRKPMIIEDGDEDDCFDEEVTKRVRRSSSKKSLRNEEGSDEDFEGASGRRGRVIRKAPKYQPIRLSDSDDDWGDGSGSSSRGTRRRGGKAKEEDEEPVHKWWLEKTELREGQKWGTLEHNGVLFPPLYTPHGIPVLYDGKEVALTPKQVCFHLFSSLHE